MVSVILIPFSYFMVVKTIRKFFKRQLPRILLFAVTLIMIMVIQATGFLETYSATQQRLLQKEAELHQTEQERLELQQKAHELQNQNSDLNTQIEQKNSTEKQLRDEIERLKAAKARSGVVYAAAGPVYGANTGDLWYRLRVCESGNDYAKNTGNGYYGAYQFSDATWDAWNTGYARADLAPPAVQDATVYKNVMAASGGFYTQHPGCAAKLGLPKYPSGPPA